jgi:hypothetical protein
MKNILNVILLLITIVLLACREKPVTSPKRNAVMAFDSTIGYEIADTITYDVIIKNPNPEDMWTEKFLHKLNRKALIDSIFSMAYAGRIKAYNIETNEQLTLRDLKGIEKQPGFNRDNIGGIQFTEAWYFNPVNKTMTKKVLALSLGYDYYSSDSQYIGRKPVFKVYINH